MRSVTSAVSSGWINPAHKREAEVSSPGAYPRIRLKASS